MRERLLPMQFCVAAMLLRQRHRVCVPVGISSFQMIIKLFTPSMAAIRFRSSAAPCHPRGRLAELIACRTNSNEGISTAHSACRQYLRRSNRFGALARRARQYRLLRRRAGLPAAREEPGRPAEQRLPSVRHRWALSAALYGDLWRLGSHGVAARPRAGASRKPFGARTMLPNFAGALFIANGCGRRA